MQSISEFRATDFSELGSISSGYLGLDSFAFLFQRILAFNYFYSLRTIPMDSKKKDVLDLGEAALNLAKTTAAAASLFVTTILELFENSNEKLRNFS